MTTADRSVTGSRATPADARAYEALKQRAEKFIANMEAEFDAPFPFDARQRILVVVLMARFAAATMIADDWEDLLK